MIQRLLRRLRECNRDDADAVTSVVTLVVRSRCWDDVAFRVENGICELYTLMQNLVKYPDCKSLEDACHEMATVQRNYIVHSMRVQACLYCMAVTQTDDEDAVRYVLRGTLRTTLVPFCLFLHRHVCDHGMSAVRRALTRTLFRDDTSVLCQWPEWNENKKTYRQAQSENTCPITLDIIEDGAIASDGHLYEREAILKHMIDSCVSPITRECIAPDLVSWQR